MPIIFNRGMASSHPSRVNSVLGSLNPQFSYSAYEEMAAAEFERILDEALGQWPDARFAAQHRVGLVPVGEPSIAVAAAAPHRAEAFAACQYVVDESKKRLPVWKKEMFDDGTVRWREGEGSSAAATRDPADPTDRQRT